MDTQQIERDAGAVEAAAKAAEERNPNADVRRWLLEGTSGTLCTLSVKRELAGWPFGSVVPYALTSDGRPFILIANMAAHTSNLRHDARASLFVQQPEVEDDPQAGWRITVMGRFEKVLPESKRAQASDEAGVVFVSDEEYADMDARYRARVPQSADYHNQHDFHYWRMSSVEKVRYIAGFGAITWLEGTSVKPMVDPGVLEGAAHAVSHMNEDHAHNLVEMCEGFYGIRPTSARMTSLSHDGFFVRTEGPEGYWFFPFERDVTGDEVRHAVIDVLRRAREKKVAKA